MAFDCFSLQYLSELKFGGKHCCFECQNSILFISEIGVLSKAFIDILCVDKTKLDTSLPDHQFELSGYHFTPIRRDCSSKRGKK